ncbi:MAG: endo-1,4-beta-xylanase, partial [Bacteroidales bacterium]|nr:endo-1,4-beta-xylanase [Bacteroidales bacterium]
MKRLLVIALVACCCATVSCSDDDSPVSIKLDNDKKDDNATNNSGDTGEDYRLDPSLTPYFFDYLKTCIDRTSHPIFKLSGAIEAWDFNSDATLRDTVSAHFDEIVAGNAMKYASCVDGNGNLNFGTVKQFCSAAQAAGVSIFGHTLAWHSQQQPAYLNSLMTKKV